jgi:putative transposase
MTEERLPLNELLQKAGDGDFLRTVAESVLQLLMEADVEGLIGAGRHERAADPADKTADLKPLQITPKAA